MASTRKIHLSSMYFSHSSRRVARECCHGGGRDPRERKQKSSSSLCFHQVSLKNNNNNFFKFKKQNSLVRETATSYTEGLDEGRGEELDHQGNWTSTGTDCFGFSSSNSILTVLDCDHNYRVVGSQGGLLPFP